MSGGSLDYFYITLEDHVDDFGDVELNELVKDLAELFHDREWYLSCDTCEGDWNESRDKFKQKWFTECGRQERIEKYLDEFTEEIRKSFGISEKYCRNCMHWSRCDDRYGQCEFVDTCYYHQYSVCDKFKKVTEVSKDE